jgi:DNA-binding transcriptional ArsR family regulator
MSQIASLSQLRLAGRLSVAYFLDIVKLGRGPLELLDALILVTVVQANVASLTREPDQALTYADYDAVPPDVLRRRVSISAIANSLRLPYETVRRRVGRMAEWGAIVVERDGIFVPGALLHSPLHRSGLDLSYERTRTYYFRLRELGLIEDLPCPAAAAVGPGDAPPIRAVARLSTDYALRIIDLLTAHIGDLLSGLIFLTVVRCNTEHLSDRERGLDGAEPRHFVADALRRPVRMSAVSEMLGVPEETVRRHVAKLTKAGLCRRTPDGLIVPAETLARKPFTQLMVDNQVTTRRMFETLARFGVLELWRAGGAPARTPEPA